MKNVKQLHPKRCKSGINSDQIIEVDGKAFIVPPDAFLNTGTTTPYGSFSTMTCHGKVAHVDRQLKLIPKIYILIWSVLKVPFWWFDCVFEWFLVEGSASLQSVLHVMALLDYGPYSNSIELWNSLWKSVYSL